MNIEILQWAKANFTFEAEEQTDQLLLLFKERKSNCILDCYISHALGRKQLEYDMNQFMLELEEIL